MDNSTNKKYSFRKLLLLGFLTNCIKAALLGFAICFVLQILQSILHEEFIPLVSRTIASPELYESTLIYTVIFIVFSMPNLFLSASDCYESDKNHA